MTAEPNVALAFRLAGRDDDGLRVVRFEGHEEMSVPYRFRLLVNAPAGHGERFEEEALGAQASLGIEAQPDRRTITGVVEQVRLLSAYELGEGVYYQLEVVPRLQLLAHSKGSRIFQDQTVKQIVSAVLEQHDLRFRWRLTGSYAPRGYCVQHQETDLQFVQRLLSEEGIFYYFEHPAWEAESTEQLVLGDDRFAYQAIAGERVLKLRDPHSQPPADRHVRRFETVRQLRTGAVRVKEFDFRRPSLDIIGNADAAASGIASDRFDESRLLLYDHHGHFEQDGMDSAEAKLHLQQLRARRNRAEGDSNCPRLLPGVTFSLDAALQKLNRDYVIVRVEHRGHAADGPRGREQAAEHERWYDNAFVCLPDDVAARPERIAWRVQQTLETATVVGPADEEIYTDEYGRIKVQFHWDLDGRKNEHSSCWIRVMQAWAGTSWGFQFIPRIGMEVLVLFTGGDVDKPMVIGSAYNGEHPPPFSLPENKTISGIRTRSSLSSEGFNELSFEDRTLYERIYLHAQRNFDEQILNNHTTSVGHDQDNRVGHNKSERIEENQTLEVGGDRSVRVGGHVSTTIAAGATTSINGALALKVSGARRDTVLGDRSDRVGGGLRISVAGHHGVEAGGNVAILAEGDHRLQVRGNGVQSVLGNALVAVKGDQSIAITGTQNLGVGKERVVNVRGDMSLRSEAQLLLHADKGLVIRCGDSRIELLPDEIRLSSPKLTLDGRDETALSGGEKAVFCLNGSEASLRAPGVAVAGQGAKLTLDSAAKLEGSAVSLGTGGGAAASVKQQSDSEEIAEGEWVLQLYEPDSLAAGKPKALSDQPVTATGHGPEPFSGSTDGSGVVRIPKHYARCVIDLEVGDYKLQIVAGGLDDSDEQEAARQRLYNLGYGHVNPDAWSEREVAQAASRFQEQHQLETWKGLSDSTKDALRDKAGG